MARRLSTDDAARRAEFIWLGPENFPWPFHARGRAWALGMVTCPTAIVTSFFLVPVSAVIPGAAGLLLQGFIALVAGTAIGVWVTRFVGRWTTPITPLGHHARVISAEAAAPKERTRVTTATACTAGTWLEYDDARTHTTATTPSFAIYREDED